MICRPEGERMAKSNRKLIGTLLIPVILIVYCIIAVALHLSIFIHLPMWAQLIYFAVAGVSWFFPAGALIKWMAKPQA